MKRSRFSEEQIIRILNEYHSVKTAKEVCAENNIAVATLYSWKKKYGDMNVEEARRLRALEEENSRMKRIIADLTLKNDLLTEINSKKW